MTNTKSSIRALLIALPVALAAFAPGRAAAQDADSARAAMRGVCPGGVVRIVTTTGDEVQGRCGRVEDARLMVDAEEGRRPVALADVERVWVRGSGWRSGATIGGVTGGLLLGGAAVFLASSLCDGGDDCGPAIFFVGAGGAAFGGLGGAVLGGAMGSTTRVWVRVYP
jgi:hypothetical protein